MNNTKVVAVALAGTLALSTALPAFAESSLAVDANAVVNAVAQGYGVGGSASSTVGAGAGTSGSHANGSVNASGSASTGLGQSIKNMLNGDKDNATSSSNTGTSTVRGNEHGATVVITRGNVDNNGATSVTVTLPTQVRNSDDLSAFAKATVKNDENVQAVESASNKVTVTYKQHAKLLGFIPVTLNATAELDADGTVGIHYPWYAMFTSTNGDELKAKVQANIASVVSEQNAVANTSAQAQLTVQQQAQAIAALKSALQESFNADLSANANVNAAGNVGQ